MMLTSFSDWVRASRRAKDLTLVKVADKAGVAQPVWSQWESGKATPRRATVVKIADALGADHKEALMRAGYLPSEVPNENDDTMKELMRELEPIIMSLGPERRKSAQRYLVDQARNLSELLTA